MDPNNGTDFATLGTSQLLRVPCALYAKSGRGDVDEDPVNEIQNLSLSGSSLSISNGNAVNLPPPADNSITSAMIIDGEIEAADMAADAVNPDEIATNAVGTDEIADGSVTAVKIVDGPGSGLDADLFDGQHGSYYQNAGNIKRSFITKIMK